MKNYLYLLFVCLLLFVGKSYGATKLVKHDFNSTLQYSIYNTFVCEVGFGVVFDEPNDIKSIRNGGSGTWSVNGFDKMVYYEGSLKVFKLYIQFLPAGIYNSILLNVTNSIGESTILTVQFPQQFECRRFTIPSPLLDYTTISDFSYKEYFGYCVDIDFNPLIPRYAIKCSMSISTGCMVNKYPSYFEFCTTLTFDYSKFGSDKIQLTISDQAGATKVIEVENTIIKYQNKTSVIKSFTAFPENNAVINRNSLGGQVIRVQAVYSELNTYQVLRRAPNSEPSKGLLILGTPEEQVLMFTSYMASNSDQFNFIDFSPQPSTLYTLSYTGYIEQKSAYSLQPIVSTAHSTETSNLIINIGLQVPQLRNDIIISPVTNIPFDNNLPTLSQYPYGISKSNQDSYIQCNAESLTPLTTFGGYYSVSYNQSYNSGNIGNYSGDANPVKIPSYPGIITSDSEGPLLRHYSAVLLENSKFLFTFNITDVGTGLLYIFGLAQDNLLAKEYLVSGDVNNGIYQYLSDSMYVGDTLSLYCYDYMGNFNIKDSQYLYSDVNLGGVSVYDSIGVQDITYFKFSRLSIDTSFSDLELILSINYKGASEYSPAPVLVVLYSDMRNGGSIYKGVWNKETQLFDITLNVQARHRGNFEYSISSPFVASQFQLEQRFPDQKVLLSSNYVDHYPPIITNLKLATSSKLALQSGESVVLGWDIEIYDYPVGLDYAVFEVSSDKDFEPRVFTFKPDSSISGSDINSTYSIRFKVSPLVNQVFSISKCILYDKNGYYSQHPYSPSTSINPAGFNAFFHNDFASQRNVQVSLSSQSTDVKAPTLKSFTIPPSSFDSFGIDRVAYFEFSLQDDVSGVSERHKPYIYIHFLYSQHYRVPSERVSYDSATGISYYKANVTFDYGRLAYGAVVSIHGIVDNALNMASFSSQDLKSLGFQSSMTNPVSSKPPVILENSDLNEDGGKFFIYGRAFGESPVVYMDKGDGVFNAISATFKSNLAITTDVPSVKGSQVVKFKVVSNSKTSNIISVFPIVNAVKVSNCSLLNQCSGNGQCIDSQCVCSTGYSGPDCSSTPSSVSSKPNNTPSLSTFSSMIILNELNELDINSKIINSYPLVGDDIWKATTVSSNLQEDADAYQYVAKLGDSGSTITVIVDIFNKDSKVSFAGYDFQMGSGTIKYTINMNAYPFTSKLNTLQLNINASIDVADSKCKLNSIKLNDDNCVEWIKLRSDSESLYGKFIQHALVDYRSVNVQNKLIVEPTLENQHAVIGINIPYYYQTATLDPDFSVLFDYDDLGDNKESSCYNGIGNENGNKNGGLSKSKVIGISVACGIVGVALIIASVYVIKNKHEMFKLKKKLSTL